MRGVWIGGTLAVLAVGVLWWNAGGSGRPVQGALVARGRIEEFIEERGQTRLPTTHLVTMPFEGRIADIVLTEGSAVKKDETVAKILEVDIENRLAEAQASVRRLQASLAENNDERIELSSLQQALKFVESMERSVDAAKEQVKAGDAKREFARDNLTRIETLFEKKASTEDDLRRARLEMVEAQVEYQQDLLLQRAMEAMQYATNLTPVIVRQYIERKTLSGAVLEQEQAEAKARLAQVELDRRRAVMKSPLDGTVLRRHETNERRLPAGTVLLELGDLRQLEVEADVLSQDVVRLRPGDRVELFGPAIGREPVAGRVARIYPAGFTKVSSLGVEEQRVKVIVAFAEGVLPPLLEAGRLGLGYRVQTRLHTAQRENALYVPRSALFRGPAGEWQLFAVRDGKAVTVFPEVGLMNDERAEIVSGLTENEPVILSPESALRPGERVAVTLPEPAERANAAKSPAP